MTTQEQAQEELVSLLTDEQRKTAKLIAKHNDLLRQTGNPMVGQLYMTSGVCDLSRKIRGEALSKLKSFDFSTQEAGINPYEENDFGSIETSDGSGFFFKINYYDRNDRDYGSSAPEDLSRTYRVLILMLKSEY